MFWAGGISTLVVERGCAPKLRRQGGQLSASAGDLLLLGAQISPRMASTPMKAIELVATIDEQHRLEAHAPEELPVRVRLILFLPDQVDSNGACDVPPASVQHRS